jgi:hypothetical protein
LGAVVRVRLVNGRTPWLQHLAEDYEERLRGTNSRGRDVLLSRARVKAVRPNYSMAGRTYVRYGRAMEQTERNRLIGNLVQRRKSIASSYQRNAPVTLDRDTMLDLLELVVDLEHAQRVT